MRPHLIAVLICLQAATAVAAGAQAAWIAPSFGTSVVFDDNVFHRPAAEGDMSLRFSPRLDARLESERVVLSGRLELDADRFARHPELTTALGHEAATVDLKYAASRRWTLSGEAAFTETRTPADLNELTALTPGRVRARRLLLNSSAAYDLGPLTAATMGYLVTADSLAGGVDVTAETASASIDRRLSVRDGIRVEYVEQHFLFGAAQMAASRAVTGEWTRQLDRATTLTLRAGPRVTDGVTAPDILASAHWALRTAGLSLGYQQTDTTLIGLTGIARTRSMTAGAERQVGRHVTVRVTSAVLDTRQRSLPTRVFRVSGECDWTLAPALAFQALYDADRQRGNLYVSDPAQTIGRHAVTVRFVVADRAARTGRRQ